MRTNANRKRERQRWMWYRTNLSTLPLSPVFIILFFILLFVFYVYGRVEYMLNGIYTALRCHIWVHAESAEQRAHEMYDIIAACIRIEQRNIYFEQENKWKRWKKKRQKQKQQQQRTETSQRIYIYKHKVYVILMYSFNINPILNTHEHVRCWLTHIYIVFLPSISLALSHPTINI